MVCCDKTYALEKYQIRSVEAAHNSVMDRRIDRRTQLTIEAVVNDVPDTGHLAAAHTLHELGIPIETALRVLTRPAERRGHGDDRRRLPRIEERRHQAR